MGRPKKSSPPSSMTEPEMEASETSEEAPEAEPARGAGKPISKAKAVRDALAHGNDSPGDGTRYLRNVHGIEMSRQMFSSYKAQMKARTAKKQEAGAGPEAAPRGGRRSVPLDDVIAPTRRGGEADLLDALSAMKPLIAQYGASKIKQMVDLLG